MITTLARKSSFPLCIRALVMIQCIHSEAWSSCRLLAWHLAKSEINYTLTLPFLFTAALSRYYTINRCFMDQSSHQTDTPNEALTLPLVLFFYLMLIPNLYNSDGFYYFITNIPQAVIHIVFPADMGCCQDVILPATASYQQCIYVIKHRINATVILHCGRLGGKWKTQ